MSQHIVSSLPSSPLTGGASAPTWWLGAQPLGSARPRPGPSHSRNQAILYLRQPASTPTLTPQKGCGTPYARSSPLLKESSVSPEDTTDLAKSSAVPSVIIKDVIDDDDEASVPDKSGLSNVKSTHGSSKQQESPPTKKAQTEYPEAHKPRSQQSVPCTTR